MDFSGAAGEYGNHFHFKTIDGHTLREEIIGSFDTDRNVPVDADVNAIRRAKWRGCEAA